VVRATPAPGLRLRQVVRRRASGSFPRAALPLNSYARGHSSAGRAPALQAGGHRFDPGWLHHFVEGRTRVSWETGVSAFSGAPERAAARWSYRRRRSRARSLAQTNSTNAGCGHGHRTVKDRMTSSTLSEKAVVARRTLGTVVLAARLSAGSSSKTSTSVPRGASNASGRFTSRTAAVPGDARCSRLLPRIRCAVGEGTARVDRQPRAAPDQ
jgi:hypothetical protein